MRLLLAAALCMSAAASTQDAQLEALHATLLILHSHAGDPPGDNFGARPELTVAKRQLRDWIESKLAAWNDAGHEAELSDELNKSLKNVTIAPGDAKEQNYLGSVGPVRISQESGRAAFNDGLTFLDVRSLAIVRGASPAVYLGTPGSVFKIVESDRPGKTNS